MSADDHNHPRKEKTYKNQRSKLGTLTESDNLNTNTNVVPVRQVHQSPARS